MSKLTVEILTPERKVLQAEADAVVVPAEEGELGILLNHAPLVAQLESGHIRLRIGEAMQHFAVSGGFVEVIGNRVSIFAEAAEMADQIDIERARQAAERAKAALRSSVSAVDLEKAEAAMRRAMARLHAADAARRHHQPTQK